MHFTCFIILANLYLAVHAIEKKTKVVVLGAGAAGVSVGKTLSASGIEDFIIVDAQPFVGGKDILL
jgi:polyamine oxidase